MHILLSILGALATAIFVVWRLYQAAYIANDLVGAAASARGLIRRWRWRRKVNVNPIDLVEDPREAASILMVAVAQADGPITERERDAILAQMQNRFGATSQQATELLVRSQWMVREGVDAAEVMRRLKPIIERTCDVQHRRELIEMLNVVAGANGQNDETTVFDIHRYGKALCA
jgi:uncharacterized tellurite resistance protein B-like protein